MAATRAKWVIGALVTVVVALAVALAVVLIDDDEDDTATTGTTTEQSDEATDEDGAADGTSATTATTAEEQAPTTATQGFVCPEGGMAAAEELQEAVDQGHQPWRTSPEDVASSCALGSTGGDVAQVDADTYRVTDPASGDSFLVDVSQPVREGAGGIWVVTTVTPD